MALVERRARLVRIWPMAGSVMILLVIGTGVWLVLFNPLLANPVHVMSGLEAGTVHVSSLTLMAAILPFMTLAVLGILVALIAFGFASIRREKKYIEIISRDINPVNK